MSQAIQIAIDCSRRMDPPLFKKISQYNSGIPLFPSYERDLHLVEALNPDTFRLDLGIGKRKYIAADLVTGSAGQIHYDFTNLDLLTKMLHQHDVLPYYSWCYIPEPLQRESDFRKLDQSVEGWQDIWRNLYREYAAHYKQTGLRIGYHEIYNEPDLHEDFLLESWETYLQMYKYGALGIKEGDPDAVVGGPAAAIPEIKEQTIAFVEWVLRENLPLDFFSFHHYWTGFSYATKLRLIREALQSDARFATTELHLNELNYVSGWQGEDSLHNKAAVVPSIFEVIDEILKAQDITMAHWAQFMESTFRDDAYGLIYRSGRKKAAFHAFHIYADLPVERVKTEILDPDSVQSTEGQASVPVGCMASCDGRRAGIVAWNRSESVQRIRIQLVQLPFKPAISRKYRIDSTHASYFDGAPEELEPEELTFAQEDELWVWEGTLPKGGTVYLTLADEGTETSAFAIPKPKPVAHAARHHYYFADRSKTNYAFFDRKTWKAYLGMGNESEACSLVGVTAETVPRRLAVTFETDNVVRNSIGSDAVLGLRIDYLIDGQATKSVFVHDGLAPSAMRDFFPWGTGKNPDTFDQIESLSDCIVDVYDYAPQVWSRERDRIILSFEMRNAGCQARADIRITVAP